MEESKAQHRRRSAMVEDATGDRQALQRLALRESFPRTNRFAPSAGLNDYANGNGAVASKPVTMLLINLSAILERTDEQLLPAVYAYVAASFNASPSQLGYITQSRALVQALASPLAGVAGHCFNRVLVVAFGCCLWGIMTALFSGCSTIIQGYLLWAVNGLGLAMVVPTGQSLTADYYPEASRGVAFGTLYLTAAMGAMLGALYATNLGHLHILGIDGWRFAFFSIACVSLAVGLFTLAFARDPRCHQRRQLWQAGMASLGLKQIFGEAKGMCLVPTFVIIIIQGIVGSTPWNALVFLTLYAQTIGMSDAYASLLVSIFLGCTAVGGFIGGWLGDVAASRFPDYGRIAVCQVSVLAGVPMSLILTKGLPLKGDGGTFALYALVLGSMGLLISWAAPACNNPIFAEIVPPHLRSMVYAFDRSFETAISASAAPVVGLLAERAFGWQGTASPTSSNGLKADLKNAHALGNALALCMSIPWGLCGLFYTGLYYTYPADREKAYRKGAAEEHQHGSQIYDVHVHETDREEELLLSRHGDDGSNLELAPLRHEGFQS